MKPDRKKVQELCIKFSGEEKRMIEEARLYLIKKIVERGDRRAKLPTFKDAAYMLVRLGFRVLFGDEGND